MRHVAISLVAMLGACEEAPEDAISASSALETELLLVPTRDIAKDGVSADGDTTSYFRNVDDGTTFASADDGATTVRNSWSASSASYTAGYSGTSGALTNVSVSFRAVAGSGVVGSIRVELYDGSTLLASALPHPLGSTYASFTDSFAGVTVSSAANLRTKIVFARVGTSGYLRCTQVFVKATAGGDPSTTNDAGTLDASSPAPTPSSSSSSSSLVTDATKVFSVPSVSKPAYLSAIEPAPFGTTITRIAGNSGASVLGGTWSTDARHHYSKDQPWSSDGSLIALQNAGTGGAIYLDGDTYAPLRAKCSSYSQGDDRWHPSPAHPHERISVKGTALSFYDVTKCATTRSWTLPFSVSYFGSGEGNPSNDGRFVVLGDATRMFVVDLEAYPTTRIGPSRTMTDCGLSSCAVDWVSVSASGKRAVVSYDGDHVRVFDIDPATLALTPHALSGNTLCAGKGSDGFVYDLGHADFAIDPADGEDVLVGQEHCGRVGQTVDGRLMGHVAKVRLRDGRVTALTSPSNEAYAHHVSTRNLDRPGWAYVGFYPQAGKRFDDEIIAVKLDGSGAVERLAHKHSAFSGCYRCESHAVPSRDGRRVMFASNWAAACGSACGTTSNVQAYVVDTR
jgi:hypothetical protein